MLFSSYLRRSKAVRRLDGEVEADVKAAVDRLGDACRALGYEPPRTSLYRALRMERSTGSSLPYWRSSMTLTRRSQRASTCARSVRRLPIATRNV